MNICQSDLTEEVKTFITQAIDRNQPISADWIANEILSKHQQIFGPDRDFYILCGSVHVRKTVQQTLRLYRDEPGQEFPEQLRMEGWDHLQKVYLVDRRGEQVITPIDKCTNTELLAKIAEYREMARGCDKHADELERYRASRFGSKAA